MNEENIDGINGCSKVRTGTQNEAALLALMEKTGYNMVQENGQRKFGGPPPGWEGPPPPRGCEVFVGKIPRDMYEDELVPVFERAGKIYEFRLMMEFSGENRGYAFVMYTTKEEAQLAIRILNNYEIRPGKFIGVCVSLDNCRLFIGAIPKEKKKEEILDEMKKVTEGVVDVIVYPSATDKTKNRGFAFVEYESHRAAAMARRKLIPGTFQLWGHTIQVDWADPEKEVDEETMQRVKVLYVRNLMISTTEETIKAEFNKFKPGAVERVKKLRDYAFVHFFNREDAVAAMSVMNGKCIDGASIEVTLAKPVNKESTWRQHLNGQISPNSENLIVFANKEESHPKTLGKPPTLPARLNGQHSPSPPEIERCTYPFFPGTKLTPISMYSLKSNHFNSAVMHLDYYCNKNNWAPPEYYLYSTTSQDGKVLLVYKIVIPAIANGSQSYFMPDKLCTTLEDAKELAAQFTLLHLGSVQMIHFLWEVCELRGVQLCLQETAVKMRICYLGKPCGEIQTQTMYLKKLCELQCCILRSSPPVLTIRSHGKFTTCRPPSWKGYFVPESVCEVFWITTPSYQFYQLEKHASPLIVLDHIQFFFLNKEESISLTGPKP